MGVIKKKLKKNVLGVTNQHESTVVEMVVCRLMGLVCTHTAQSERR